MMTINKEAATHVHVFGEKEHLTFKKIVCLFDLKLTLQDCPSLTHGGLTEIPLLFDFSVSLGLQMLNNMKRKFAIYVHQTFLVGVFPNLDLVFLKIGSFLKKAHMYYLHNLSHFFNFLL